MAEFVAADVAEVTSAAVSTRFPLPVAATGAQPGDVLHVNVTCANEGATLAAGGVPDGALTVVPMSSASGVGVSGGVYLYPVPDPVPDVVEFVWSSSQRGTVAWELVRGCDVDALVDAVQPGAWAGSASTAHTLPSLTTTRPGAYVTGGVMIGSGSDTPVVPSPWTGRTDATQREGRIAARGVLADPGASGDVVLTTTGAYRSRTWQVALAPAPVSGAAPARTLDLQTAGGPVDVEFEQDAGPILRWGVVVDGAVVMLGDPPEPLPADLVARWRLDDPDDLGAEDVSGRSLTLDGATAVPLGDGYGLGAASGSARAYTADGFLPRAGFTVAARFLPTSAAGATQRIAFLAGATAVAELYYWRRTLGPSLYDVRRASVVIGGTSRNALNNATSRPVAPHTLAAVYDGAAIALYEDGALVQSTAASGIVDMPDSFEVAVVADGAIGNAQVWSRALSAAEVAALG